MLMRGDIRYGDEDGDGDALMDWERRGFFRTTIVGEESQDRTPSGLWPSDHAGLVGSIRIPGGGN